jgi:ATP synthase subunit 6
VLVLTGVVLLALIFILVFYTSECLALYGQIRALVGFVTDVITSYISTIFEAFSVIVLALFLFIFFYNYLSMLPGVFCLNGQFIVTFTLSSMFFFAILFLSIWVGKFHFFAHFVPSGVPGFLKPFLTIIEVISYISRLFSLAIRLFANLVAGHSLLHILSDATLDIGDALSYVDITLLVIVLVPLAIVSAVFLLELGIAGLQAYVFTVLALIYLREAEAFYRMPFTSNNSATHH